MLSCGSEESGFATYQCLGCGKGEHKVNFSCKGKACPQCGKRYVRDSMVNIATKLFPGVSYRQVVLMLPEQLANYANVSACVLKLYAYFNKGGIKKWTIPIHNWRLALSYFMIEFDERLSDYI